MSANGHSNAIARKTLAGMKHMFQSIGLYLLVWLLVVFITSCGGASSPPHSSTPTPPGPQGHLISGNVQPSLTGPYGFTILRDFDQSIVNQVKQIGATWVRYQLDWSNIEPQRGQFNWSTLDSVVSLANANGIHIDFPLQKAPNWAKSQTCGGQPLLPGTTEMAQYATAVAQRYNGQNGHGYIDSYEIGNEEFDDHLPPIKKIIDKYCPGMNLLPIAAPDLKAGYQAIKSQSPNATVGMFAIWWPNLPHIQSYMQYLYQNHYGTYFDYANFHYYICNNDPSSSSGERPSFDQEWQVIHQIMARNGDSGKPIWNTEIGWSTSSYAHPAKCTVNPQVQAQYMTYVLNSAANSHVVQHLFWYTLDPKQRDDSVIQPQSGALPGFYVMQQFARQRPTW
jgi:Glycosyl hydrolase family 10